MSLCPCFTGFLTCSTLKWRGHWRRQKFSHHTSTYDGQLSVLEDQNYLWEHPAHFQHLVFSPALGNKTPGTCYQHGLPNPWDFCRRKSQFHAEVCWKAIDSGAGLLFWWTPHRLAAVDGVDVFHPYFDLLFLAVGNQIHEEDLCV